MPRPVLTVILLVAVTALATAAVVAHPATARGHRSGRVHASAPSWPALGTAAGFLRTEIREKALGRWDVVWHELYPTHRRVAGRAAYVRCESATPFSAPLQSFRVVGVRRSLVHVAGEAKAVPGVALTTHVALRWYGPRDPITFTQTFHLVPVEGRWTWILSPSRYRLYAADGCSFHPAA